MKKVRDRHKTTEHPENHDIHSDACALCRISTLVKDVRSGSKHAVVALLMVAHSASRALQELIDSKNQEALELRAKCLNWPIVMPADSPFVTKLVPGLGRAHVSMPVSLGRLYKRMTASRYLLLAFFRAIAGLRAFHREQQEKAESRAADSFRRSESVLADLMEAARTLSKDETNTLLAGLAAKWTRFPPEWTSPKRASLAELKEHLKTLTELLELDTPISARGFVSKFTSSAVALPLEGDTAALAWFELAWQIILHLTNGNPSSTRILRSLAAGRERHVLDRRATGKSSRSKPKIDGELNTRIRERLVQPLKVLQ